jgi:8-oxo-dGTP pyrophosphatase MutT (NUDIX family)
MIEAAILTLIRERLTIALRRPRGPLRTLRVDGRIAGRFDTVRAARLAAFGRVFEATADGLAFVPALSADELRSEALAEVAHTLAAEGRLSPWRAERYAVGPTLGAAPWFRLERAAARYFGIRTYAAHVNGLVGSRTAPALWFARRSPQKAIDPGLLDNLVGGGVAAGQTIAATVIKEAWEEAGIEAALARQCVPAGTVHVFREASDGVQHETVFVHDLRLPEDFLPTPTDGEVIDFRRVDLGQAAQLIAQSSGPDVVTVDASLVVLDCLLRRGMLPPDAADYLPLEALRHAVPDEVPCGPC